MWASPIRRSRVDPLEVTNMQPYPDLPADLQAVIKFHGHLCPGIVIG